MQVFGNLLNYAILYGGKTPLPNDETDNISTTPTTTPTTERDLSICGKNDCQDPNITNQNLNRYEPASEKLVYILIGMTAALVVVAMLIQIFIVKTIDPSKEAPFEKDEKAEDDERLFENQVGGISVNRFCS